MAISPFVIIASGCRADRQALVGTLVEDSANLVSEFRNYGGKIIFFFRYRGDARLVLKRVSRSLSVKPVSADVLQYGSATAEIKKSV